MVTVVNSTRISEEGRCKVLGKDQPRQSFCNAPRQYLTATMDGKSHDASSRGAQFDEAVSIKYFYLSFDTVMPTIPTPQQAGFSNENNLPSCPDLQPYISPLKRSSAGKNVSLALSCIATFLTACTAGCYSPSAGAIAHDLNTSRLVTFVGITTFCMDFAFAPMALAPISEIWGRFPVFVITGATFVVFQAVCSVMPHIAGLLIARFFIGVGASVFSSVVGGVIADLLA